MANSFDVGVELRTNFGKDGLYPMVRLTPSDFDPVEDVLMLSADLGGFSVSFGVHGGDLRRLVREMDRVFDESGRRGHER